MIDNLLRVFVSVRQLPPNEPHNMHEMMNFVLPRSILQPKKKPFYNKIDSISINFNLKKLHMERHLRRLHKIMWQQRRKKKEEEKKNAIYMEFNGLAPMRRHTHTHTHDGWEKKATVLRRYILNSAATMQPHFRDESLREGRCHWLQYLSTAHMVYRWEWCFRRANWYYELRWEFFFEWIGRLFIAKSNSIDRTLWLICNWLYSIDQ